MARESDGSLVSGWTMRGDARLVKEPILRFCVSKAFATWKVCNFNRWQSCVKGMAGQGLASVRSRSVICSTKTSIAGKKEMEIHVNNGQMVRRILRNSVNAVGAQ